MKERTQSIICTDNHWACPKWDSPTRARPDKLPSATAVGVSSDFIVANKLVLLKLSKSVVACDKKISPITKVIGTNLVRL